MPASFQQWAQVAKQLTTMSAFRANLRNYAPDEVILAQRRAAVVKDGVSIIRTKMELAISSPQDQNQFVIKLLQEDLQSLVTEINSTCQSGIVWTDANFGGKRSELQEWRQYSLTLLQTLLETKKKEDSEETDQLGQIGLADGAWKSRISPQSSTDLKWCRIV